MRSEVRNPKAERSPRSETRIALARCCAVRASDFGLPSAFGLRTSVFHVITRTRLLVAGILALAAGVLFCFNPSQHSFYPVCWFHQWTGLLCPGCGSLRALHQLLHGRMVAAFHFNPLLVSGLPLLGWLGLRAFMRKRNGQPWQMIQPAWLWAALVLLLVFGVLRNLPFAHAIWLAP